MGWERKRGKLHELNALLRGSTDTDFLTTGARRVDARRRTSATSSRSMPTPGCPRGAVGAPRRDDGPPAQPPGASTRRPGGSSTATAILQPRVTATLPAEREASLFQRIFSGLGRDRPVRVRRLRRLPGPLRRGQLHRQGHLRRRRLRAGAGRPRAREHAAEPRPARGHFARAGLVTDIELFDEFPSHYLEAAARQHRWARGDWQLLPWILGRARDAAGQRSRSPIPGIARWKMVDNLRRTLSAPLGAGDARRGLDAALGVGRLWTGFVAGGRCSCRPRCPSSRGCCRGGGASRSAVTCGPWARTSPSPPPRSALGLTFLAHQAWLMLDAIVRTLARLYVTHRDLLEWTTAAQAKASLRPRPGGVLPADGRRRGDRGRRWRSSCSS